MALLGHAANWTLASKGACHTRVAAQRPRGRDRAALLRSSLCALAFVGCTSKVEIATWSCPAATQISLSGLAGASGTADASGAAGSATLAEPSASPWSTSFEDKICDYSAGRGFCYEVGSGKFDIVTEPVHSGKYAAAFTVRTPADGQARCVREGNFPTAAYYGAWYFVPALATNMRLWNLIHFQGNGEGHGGHLWDVSLDDKDTGQLQLFVFSYLNDMPEQWTNVPVPIGTWFHVEIYIKRAADKSGEVILYQDEEEVVHLTNLITDNSSGEFQWYVGNLAEELDPGESTLYVDDLTIRETR